MTFPIINLLPNACCNSCNNVEWNEENDEELWCPINQRPVKHHFVCKGYKGCFEVKI